MGEHFLAFLPSPDPYDDETLTTLVQALRDVCQVLEAHLTYPKDIDPVLKQELAFRLMALVDSGIRDPQELRSRTLKSFPLARPQ
jgi:hypothetical protein